MNIRQKVPWWCKIIIKIILSNLPVGYAFWKCIGIFEHGDMHQPSRAFELFITHAESAHLLADDHFGNKTLRMSTPSNGDYSVLELGPGDSLFTALIAKALGATRSWLVDAGSYATKNMAFYAQMCDYLRHLGYISVEHSVDQLIKPSVAQLLSKCNAVYLIEGTISIATIPDNSVDFCFSNAVLEHIPKSEFNNLIRELWRVLKTDGVCVHRVDLKDHLGGGLNNLRFSESIWEGNFFRNSGFYTNRIRFTEMLLIFQQAGFEYQLVQVVRFGKLPLSRSVLAKSFCQLSEYDLLVSGFDVVLKKCANFSCN